MSEERNAGRRRGYLVEHYRPGQSAAELECAAAQVRDAFVELERDGEPVHFVHATIVEADESFLCVVEAASEELVRAAYERTSVRYERVSAALTDTQ